MFSAGMFSAFACSDGAAQAGIAVGVSSAELGGDGDFFDQAGEDSCRAWRRGRPFLCLIVAHFEWPDMYNLRD